MTDVFLFNRYTRKDHRGSENSHEGRGFSFGPSMIVHGFFFVQNKDVIASTTLRVRDLSSCFIL